MPKSKYLDDLISNKMEPRNYYSRYLSRLWEESTNGNYTNQKSSFLNNFTNEIDVIVTGSAYLNSINTNQTVAYMDSTYLSSMVTFDTSKLPVNRLKRKFIGENHDSKNFILPPDYIKAVITPIKGNTPGDEIPVIFPASFSRSRTANFAKESPVGSTTPIMAYSYTDAEEIPMEFDALVDYLPNGYVTLNDYVDDIVSILLPGGDSSDSKVITEPTVQVSFADITFRGVCTNVSISYDNLYGGPKDDNGKVGFVHARISCQFTRLS